MKTYIIGTDPMPVFGSYIVLLTHDTNNVYSNKIEMNYGKVEADFPEKYDTIEEALADGVNVCTDSDGLWYDDNGHVHEIAYWIVEADQFYLCDGLKWAYFHDFLFEAVSGAFPFYDLEYMELAHTHNWVNVVYHSKVDMEYPNDEKFIRHTYTIEVNGAFFKAGWNEFPCHTYFTGVYDPADFGEPNDTPYRIQFR